MPATPVQPDAAGRSRDAGALVRWLGRGAWSIGWRLALLAVLAAVIAAVVAWLYRVPIAERFVDRALAERGVRASYRIERLGPGDQILRDVRIGDPRRPDLTADSVRIVVRVRWGRARLTAIEASGVRVRGAWANGRMRFGEVDRLLGPSDPDAPLLPDLDMRIADARAMLTLPGGVAMLTLDGAGNPSRLFGGRLGVSADRMTIGDCVATGIVQRGSVTTSFVAIDWAGPGGIDRIRCAGRGRASDVAGRLSLALPTGVSRLRGRWTGRVGAVAAAGVAFDDIAVATRFTGDPSATALSGSVGAGRVTIAGVGRGGARFDGTARIASAGQSVDGRLRVTDATGDPALLRAWPAGAGAGTPIAPIAPIAAALRAAGEDALRRFSGEADVRLASGRVGGRAGGRVLTIDRIALASASGVRVTGGADHRLRWVARDGVPPVWAGDGAVRIAGGGLPDTQARLRWTGGATIDGVVDVAPVSAGGATLTAGRILVRRDRSGWTLAGAPLLSGPVGALGRVEGLSAPIRARIDGRGIALTGSDGQACIPIRLAGARWQGWRVDPIRQTICGDGALLIRGGAPIGGRWTVRNVSLGAVRGQTRAIARSDAVSLAWPSGRFDARRPTLTLGPLSIGAATLSGRIARGGATGRVSGGTASLPAVPLDLSAIDGAWRYEGQRLSLDGAMVLTDRQTPARFEPLKAEAASLNLVGQRITHTAAWTTRDGGVPVVSSVVTHDLSSAAGGADLTLAAVTFGPDLQPEAVTPLTRGIVANLAGTITGTGRIDWSPTGVVSIGTVRTDRLDLAAPFGPVKGLAGELRFDDLLGLASASGQTLAIAELNPGVPVTDGQLSYQLLPGRRVRVEGGRWPFAGGQLVLQPAILEFDGQATHRLLFDVQGVDAAKFLQQFGYANITATGVFDGQLPIVVDQSGARIVDGVLTVRDGGGTLAYVGELTNRDLGTLGNLAFGALRSIRYRDLIVRMDGALAGEMVTDVRFSGLAQGDGATRNILTRRLEKLPFVFNIKVRGPFRQLIASAKAYYDPSLLVAQNLPALLRAEAEAEAAAAEARARTGTSPTKTEPPGTKDAPAMPPEMTTPPPVQPPARPDVP